MSNASSARLDPLFVEHASVEAIEWQLRAEERVATEMRERLAEAHFECDCVPKLGPSHCHACSEAVGREIPCSGAVHAPIATDSSV